MSRLEQHTPGIYILPQGPNMKVPGMIIATEHLVEEISLDRTLDQVCNVAQLPGIIGYSIAMPDIHFGYGFPIGGIAAMDINTGVISPGGVGYDINCGIRLAIVPMSYEKLKDNKKQLLEEIFRIVPSGVGHQTNKSLNSLEYTDLIKKGSRWSLEQGCGFEEDIEHTENYGCIENASINNVSELALNRGRNQLGTLGSGNHFIEIGEVQKILLPEIAREWGIEKGQMYILIHSGSRGFGHQICQDTLNMFIKAGYANNLPDKQLVAAPIQSYDGQYYIKAMAAAANFAFNNRQQILHNVRLAFNKILKIPTREIKLIYDICHNIAKIEDHNVNGLVKKLCVHRKGATRALGPYDKSLPNFLQKTGQPVLVPGDMGSAS